MHALRNFVTFSIKIDCARLNVDGDIMQLLLNGCDSYANEISNAFKFVSFFITFSTLHSKCMCLCLGTIQMRRIRDELNRVRIN